MNMNVRGKFKDEFNDLQRRLELLRRDLETLDATPSSPGQGTLTRMARIEGTPNPGERVFQIIFVDAAYDPTDLTSAPATTDRQVTPRHTCLNITGETLTQGDLVIVFKLNGQWFAFVKALQQDTSTGIVRIDESPGIGDCESASRSTECTWSAFIQNVDGTGATVCSPFSDNYAVWLIDVGHCSPVTALQKNERFVAVKVAPQYDPDPGGAGTDPRELWAIRSPVSTSTATGVVRVEGTGASCDDITQQASCAWEGFVLSVDTGQADVCDPFTDNYAVWLIDVNNCNSVTTLKKNEQYIAIRIASVWDPDPGGGGTDPRELWAVKDPVKPSLITGLGTPNGTRQVTSVSAATPDFMFVGANDWQTDTSRILWQNVGPNGTALIKSDRDFVCSYAFVASGDDEDVDDFDVTLRLYFSDDQIAWTALSTDPGIRIAGSPEGSAPLRIGASQLAVPIAAVGNDRYYRLGAFKSSISPTVLVDNVSWRFDEYQPLLVNP